MRWIGDTLLVHAAGEPNAEIMADVLARQPEVEWAEHNYLATSTPCRTTPLIHGSGTSAPSICLPHGISVGGGSSSVTVAVLDTGIETTTASYTFSLWNGTAFANATIPFATDPDLSTSRMTGARDFAFWTGPVLDMVGTARHRWNDSAGHQQQLRLRRCGVQRPADAGTKCSSATGRYRSSGRIHMPGFADPDEGGCAVADLIAGIR